MASFPRSLTRVKDAAWLKGSAGVPATDDEGSMQKRMRDWPFWILREGSKGEPLCVRFDVQCGKVLEESAVRCK